MVYMIPLRLIFFSSNNQILYAQLFSCMIFLVVALDTTNYLLQRLDIRGRVKVLHGQNRKTEEPPLALFALCTPFGPPSLLEVPQKEVMFKSKHKLDLALVTMDQKGKMLLGYSDAELTNLGGYDLVHYDDLAYVASAHQECKSIVEALICIYNIKFCPHNFPRKQTEKIKMHRIELISLLFLIIIIIIIKYANIN